MVNKEAWDLAFEFWKEALKYMPVITLFRIVFGAIQYSLGDSEAIERAIKQPVVATIVLLLALVISKFIGALVAIGQ